MLSHSAALRAERDKRVNFILSFVNDLPLRLSPHIDVTLAVELQGNILPEFPLKAHRTYAARFDSKGTELWNIVIRENRNKQPNSKGKGKERVAEYSQERFILALVKVFAAFLVDAGYASGHANEVVENGSEVEAATIRIIKVLLSAARTCLCEEAYDWGTKMLERVAEHIAQFDGEQTGKLGKRMTAEFLVLRVMFAWKQSNADLVEHMFKQIDTSLLRDASYTAEELADTLYEIGTSEIKSKHWASAAKWLERSYDILSDVDTSRMSENASNLKVCTMQLLTKVYLNMKSEGGREKARNLLGLMESEFGQDQIVVSLLQLEFIKSAPCPKESSEITAFHGTMIRLFRTMQLTKENFKTLIQNINRLRVLSPETAYQAIDDFLNLRLFKEQHTEYMEQVVVLRIWITVNFIDQTQSQQSLLEFLDLLERNTKTAFDTRTANAIQSVIWKVITLNIAQRLFGKAKELCQMALHPLLEQAGDGNKAKICRKMMLCALEMNDYITARKAFFSMSDASQNHLQSRFLLYKVALRNNDEELASICLDIITKGSSKDATLVYACVLDAQQTGNKSLAAKALQIVLERYNYRTPEGVHLPALLRCLLKLKRSEIIKDETFDEKLIETFSIIFERASEEASKSLTAKISGDLIMSNQNWDESEMEWFSRNCYNFAVEYCNTIHPKHLFRLANACLQFMDLLNKLKPLKDIQLQRRHILVQYLCMLSSLALARGAQDIENSVKHYSLVRKHSFAIWQSITLFVEVNFCSTTPNDSEQNLRAEMRLKFTDAVKYCLEACLRLQHWEDLDPILDLFLKKSDLAIEVDWVTFADLGFLINQELGRSNPKERLGMFKAWHERVLQFVSRTIRVASSGSSPNLSLLARYIRTLFCITISSQPQVAVNLIEHVVDLAKRFPANSDAKVEDVFPTSTIDFISTTTFNHAVDCFSSGDDIGCREWSARALALAKAIENSDNGELKGILSEKVRMLLLGGKESQNSVAVGTAIDEES